MKIDMIGELLSLVILLYNYAGDCTKRVEVYKQFAGYDP